jgi:hypothetical protein
MLGPALLNSFPTVPQLFHSSAPAIVLSQLREYLITLPPNKYSASRNLSDCHRSVSVAWAILDAVSSLTFRGDIVQSPIMNDGILEQEDTSPHSPTKVKGKRAIQRVPKRTTPQKAAPPPRTPFDDLGIPTPQTRTEVDDLVSSVLEEQKSILQVC